MISTTMATKKVFLWTAPRCVSTAFERCIMEVKDSKIFHEPFSRSYHFGPERQSPRYLSDDVDNTASYEEMISLLTKEYDGLDLIFSKDMAYAIENHFDMLFDKRFDGFQHTFLIRNPKKTVPSLYRASTNKQLTGWEAFDPHEAGFEQLYNLYEFVKANFEPNPVVFDADDLLQEPETVVKGFCDSINIPFDKNILTWEPGEKSGWETWTGWHDDVLKSSGFSKRSPDSLNKYKDLSGYPEEVYKCIEYSLPFYNEMHNMKTIKF